MDQTEPRTKRGGRGVAENISGGGGTTHTYTITGEPILSLYTPLDMYLPDSNFIQLTMGQHQSPAILQS